MLDHSPTKAHTKIKQVLARIRFRRTGIWLIGCAGTAIIFAAGSFFGPAIGDIGSKLLSPLVKAVEPDESALSIENFNPLVNCRFQLHFLTNGHDRIAADVTGHALNMTYLKITNSSDKSLKNIQLTVGRHFGGADPNPLWMTVYARSKLAGSNYRTKYEDHLLSIDIPILNPGDFIWIASVFDSPVETQVDAFSDGFTFSRVFFPVAESKLRLNVVNGVPIFYGRDQNSCKDDKPEHCHWTPINASFDVKPGEEHAPKTGVLFTTPRKIPAVESPVIVDSTE